MAPTAPTNATPKKGTPKKGTLNKTPTKVTPSKATPKKGKPRTKMTVSDLCKSTETLHFLWAALQYELQKNSSAVDYQAVSETLGITKCAATFKYYRIRDAFANDAENGQGSEQEDRPVKQRAKNAKSDEKKSRSEATQSPAIKAEVSAVKTEIKTEISAVKAEEVEMTHANFEEIDFCEV
ncbi:hypothetical protein PENDEC_c001G01131 [Penicillium decumbens]|uniref:Myb-like DNA-binding domain-containing protein n=1 Tax=Penicillium decumbens TaxID=69771 RepID=A0A1V6PMM1_PENDC|nr:hypothetical protein PENDEC_c001G01131 [Penicillium decumbens]